jgi:hypothetical protein
VSSDTDAPTATTAFVTKGHNSCKNGRRKIFFFTIIYTSSCVIISLSLKEIRPVVIEELMTKDLGTYVNTDIWTSATLYATLFVGEKKSIN